MRTYALTEEDGTILLNLNASGDDGPAKGSFTLGSDLFTYENRIVENSGLPGAIKLGATRIESRDVSLKLVRAYPDDSDFRDAENELIESLLKAFYLRDLTNSLQVPIAVIDHSIGYDTGGYQLSSEDEINLKLLDPFWESINVSNESESLSVDINDISLTNSGKLPVPPILTFTAAVAVTSLDIYMDSTKEGIQISDSLFGTSTYTTLIVNCKLGTINLTGFDRTLSIVAGSGYFEFPTGDQDLIILPSALCDVNIDWYERFHI